MSVKRTARSIRDLSKDDLGFDPYDCIREVENAYSREGGLIILYGNLAPKGAVVKAAGVKPEYAQIHRPGGDFRVRTRVLRRNRQRQGQGRATWS